MDGPLPLTPARLKFIARIRRALEHLNQHFKEKRQPKSARRRRQIWSPKRLAEAHPASASSRVKDSNNEDDGYEADSDKDVQEAARHDRARSLSPDFEDEAELESGRRGGPLGSLGDCGGQTHTFSTLSSTPTLQTSFERELSSSATSSSPLNHSASPTPPISSSSASTNTMSSASGSPPGSPAAGANKDDDDVASPPAKNLADDLSDDDSELSDVDEAQFEDFDPTALALDRDDEVRDVADEETVKLLGRHKRKREEGAEVDAGKKKKKEGRREKERKERKKREKKEREDDDFVKGEVVEGKRRQKDGPRERKKPVVEEVNEEDLSPEERRRRALDRAMDAALKKPNQSRRRKHGDIDLVSTADEEIADLRNRMADAAAADVDARSADPPRPAMHKLKLLPEVVALLNRNGREIENAIVDPENNLLESVRFFLEPLRDGSLPAYNIQRELFAALGKLPIDKEALRSSGLGKVVVFYTKAKKVELPIKRGAERLLAEWTRPILKRSDDFRMRQFETRAYDPRNAAASAKKKGASQAAAETPEQRRARQIANPAAAKDNRARIDVMAMAQSYSIVPQNNQTHGQLDLARPMGASGDEAFRRMRARQMAAMGKGPRRGG